MKRVALHTLGCKLNFAETSTIGRQFVERGFNVVDSHEPTDVFVLNTCSVTERADRECRQLIRRALRTSPDAYVIVVGCYAQLEPGEIASIEGVDLVLGAREKFRLPEVSEGFQKKGVPQVFVSCIDEATEVFPAFSADVGGRTRAFLKIQDGCDYTCSFCTIPLARGESRSLPVSQLLEQARTIASMGYKEIVLTGVNVGDYGRKEGVSLLDLCQVLEPVDGIERYRISSIEPNLATRPLLDFILNSEKFCNHFHIPLQSGSDTVLMRMRRRYLRDRYEDVVEYIKAADGDAAIGADVIVGFPGESDSEFQETCSFISDLPVSYLHVFTYSERPNTPAAAAVDQLDPALRRLRNERLRMLGLKKKHAFHSSFLGRSMPVLFEGRVSNQRVTGLTENYIRVEVPGSAAVTNSLCSVVLDSVTDETVTGHFPETSSAVSVPGTAEA